MPPETRFLSVAKRSRRMPSQQIHLVRWCTLTWWPMNVLAVSLAHMPTRVEPNFPHSSIIDLHSSSLSSSSSSSSSSVAAAAFLAGFFFFFLFLLFVPVDLANGRSRIARISSSSSFLSDLTASRSNGGGAARRTKPFFVIARQHTQYAG